MKVKIEKVNIGLYEYDSIVVKIDNNRTEIVFRKEDKISQYKEGKEVDLVKENGIYKIKPTTSTSVNKND